MSAYIPDKLRKDQAIAMCKTRMEWDSFISWTDTHTRHTGKAMPSFKTVLFCRKEKGSSYILLTEGNTDQIWCSTSSDKSSKKKKSPQNLLIVIFELKKKGRFYCFFLLLTNNPFDTWKHALQGRTTWSIS